MKLIKFKIWFIILLCFATMCSVCRAYEPYPQSQREYKIKAAFLYNFLKTVEWPVPKSETEKQELQKRPIIIGIVGKDPFGDAFEPVKGSMIRERKVEIRILESPGSFIDVNKEGKPSVSAGYAESLRVCDIIFICQSEQAHISILLETVQSRSILTVSETERFLENGGMINFIPKAEKGEFEINLTPMEQKELKVSSKLLRIATRVMGSKEDKP